MRVSCSNHFPRTPPPQWNVRVSVSPRENTAEYCLIAEFTAMTGLTRRHKYLRMKKRCCTRREVANEDMNLEIEENLAITAVAGVHVLSTRTCDSCLLHVLPRFQRSLDYLDIFLLLWPFLENQTPRKCVTWMLHLYLSFYCVLSVFYDNFTPSVKLMCDFHLHKLHKNSQMWIYWLLWPGLTFTHW